MLQFLNKLEAFCVLLPNSLQKTDSFEIDWYIFDFQLQFYFSSDINYESTGH